MKPRKPSPSLAPHTTHLSAGCDKHKLPQPSPSAAHRTAHLSHQYHEEKFHEPSH